MTKRARLPLAKKVRDATKRYAPHWFAWVTVRKGVWIVVDSKRRFWRAERVTWTRTGERTAEDSDAPRRALVADEILVPVFGPCEKIEDAVDMTVTVNLAPTK